VTESHFIKSAIEFAFGENANAAHAVMFPANYQS
jgi:hypothetical protein